MCSVDKLSIGDKEKILKIFDTWQYDGSYAWVSYSFESERHCNINWAESVVVELYFVFGS